MRKTIHICNNCGRELEFKKRHYIHDDDEHDSYDLCEKCIDEVCEVACRKALKNPQSTSVSVNYAEVPYYIETPVNNREYQILVIDQEFFYLVETEEEMVGILLIYLKNRFEVKEGEK